MYEGFPDMILLEVLVFLFMFCDIVVEVAIVGELHDDADWRGEYHRLLPSRKAYL